MFKAFVKDESGQFAIMFALFTTMLIAAVGIGIDLTSMQSTKQNNQNLADAAVLAAAISGEQSYGQLKQIAEASVAAMTNNSDDYDVQLVVLDDNSIQVKVTKVHAGFLYGGERDVGAISEAPPKGQGKLNIALVLDVTDSMNGDKLDALKDAADNLIQVFKDEDDDDDDDDDNDDSSSEPAVKMSVVPFARYARLPMSMASESWLYVEPPNLNCWDRLDLAASQAAGICVPSDEEGEDWDCTNPVEYEHCEVLSWSGCVTSRVAPWHSRSYVGAVDIPGFAGGGGCGPEILPMTADLDEVEDAVDDLWTYGETYIPSGLMWGWRALTPEAPLTQASSADYSDRKHALILMTDGENSRSYGGTKENGFPGVFHWERDMDDANDLTAETCEDIKLDGIEIYTVAFEVSDNPTLNMLSDCASHPDKFFDASNASQLESAFETIGDELAQVRLSR